MGVMFDFMDVVNPSTTSNFFERMELKPAKSMMKYILFFGIFFFIGELGLEPITWTKIRLATVYYVASVTTTINIGLAFGLMGRLIAKRDVNISEGMTIVRHVAVVALVGGIFRLLPEMEPFYWLALAYSLYILYVAVRTRFGFENAPQFLAVAIIIGSITAMLVFIVGVFILRIPSKYYLPGG